MDERLSRVSDLLQLEGIKGNAATIIVSDSGDFKVVARAGDDGDIPLTGGQSFIIVTHAAGVAEISGAPWDNSSNGAVAAPPMTMVSHKVDAGTPVLALHGAVVDEVTDPAQDDFRVTVTNLFTGTSLSTRSDAEGRYSMTFVVLASSPDLWMGVGDNLEVTAETPSPLIRVQPLRHIVSATEVKESQIRLPNLVAYEIPKETKLSANYPNPFNPETWIPYQLAEDTRVTVQIYDIGGKLVRALPLGLKPAGFYLTPGRAAYWDGRTQFGEGVASGVYFYTLEAGDFRATRKMVLKK
jgi:hypothetical protein